jgi:hypothetical protein
VVCWSEAAPKLAFLTDAFPLGTFIVWLQAPSNCAAKMHTIVKNGAFCCRNKLGENQVDFRALL